MKTFIITDDPSDPRNLYVECIDGRKWRIAGIDVREPRKNGPMPANIPAFEQMEYVGHARACVHFTNPAKDWGFNVSGETYFGPGDPNARWSLEGGGCAEIQIPDFGEDGFSIEERQRRQVFGPRHGRVNESSIIMTLPDDTIVSNRFSKDSYNNPAPEAELIAA